MGLLLNEAEHRRENLLPRQAGGARWRLPAAEDLEVGSPGWRGRRFQRQLPPGRSAGLGKQTERASSQDVL